MANSTGKMFVVTSIGESHGRLVGVVVDGCPAGLKLNTVDIQAELERRRPGGIASTPRNEPDRLDILSGLFNGHTTGAPLTMVVWNRDVQSENYHQIASVPRPGHADLTSRIKYGQQADYRGGGRFSGRLTAGLVMAGAVARQLLALKGIEILAHTVELGSIKAAQAGLEEIRKCRQDNEFICADKQVLSEMKKAVEQSRQLGDSLGGIVECIALGVPAGLGEPVFDNLDGQLAEAFFAIPAVKGVEFGSGFGGAGMKGSQNNDAITIKDGKIGYQTNNAGGILGGLSTGMPLKARIAFKPTPSIALPQQSVDLTTNRPADLEIEGRHDICIVPRAVVVVEAMMAMTLADFALQAGLVPRVIK